MGPPCFIQKLYPPNNAKLILWINATQKHPINNYQSISKSLEVIRREIDIFDDKSTFNQLANHNHSKYNGKWRGGKRWNFTLSEKKESTKNDCFIILIIALCQMTGHQLIKKNLHYWHTKNNLKLYSISKWILI